MDSPVPIAYNGSIYTNSPSSQPFAVVSPITGSELPYKVVSASVDQAKQAAAAAATPLNKSWTNASPAWRAQQMLTVADRLRADRDTHAQIAHRETGIPVPVAQTLFDSAIDYLVLMAHAAGALSTSRSAQSAALSAASAKTGLVFTSPIGPVLAIAPWNAPAILAMRAVATPLAAGCPVIFKANEQSPGAHWSVLRHFADPLLFPPGTFAFLNASRPLTPDLVAALVDSPHIAKINFTGSDPVGRIIAARAGAALKPLVLELGGKAPTILCEDAATDPAFLETAVTSILVGSWLHSGQFCMSTDSIFVPQSIQDKFIATAKKIGSLLLSDPAFTDDSYSTAAGATRYAALVDDALTRGAQIIVGQHSDPASSPSLTRLKKCLLHNMTQEMRITTSEIFGPAAIVQYYTSLADAVTAANSLSYGLNASVWTPNVAKGLALAHRLKMGSVHINGLTVFDDPALPHGGTKNSGYGRFGGSWGIQEYLVPKTITIPEYQLDF